MGAASVLLSTARVWPIPLAGIFTFCFPFAVLSVLPVHQRLSSAKREGPREGGSESEESKHPGALPTLVPKQEVGGASAEMAGRSLSDGGCPKSRGPGSVYDRGLGWVRPSWARSLRLDSWNQVSQEPGGGRGWGKRKPS